MPEQSNMTRRDFLTFWKKNHNKKGNGPPQSILEEKTPHMPSLNRRQFLKVLLAVGASLAVKHYLDIELPEVERRNQLEGQESGTLQQMQEQLAEQHQGAANPPQSLPSEKEPTIVDTEIETALLIMAEMVSARILKALKIPVGNASLNQKEIRGILEQDLSRIITRDGVVSSFFEEALCRALPNFIVRGQPKESLWEIGIPVSAFFALCHNVKKDENTGKRVFATDKIPLYQFVNGLFFWKMMRERGFPHAVAAHATINSVALSVAKLLYEAFPSKSYSGVSKEIVGK